MIGIQIRWQLFANENKNKKNKQKKAISTSYCIV
jgi:hypothetical protein